MSKIFLETKRLILREIHIGDFSELVPMLGDPEVMYAWEHGFSDDEIRAWITRRENGYRENGFDYFLAVDKVTGTAVGQIGLLKETLGEETLYGIGWILKKSEWGKGYAFEGAHAVMDYAFRLLKLPELVADIRPENTSSGRVAEKLGMRETNTVVKIVDGKEMPHVVYRMKNPYRVYCGFRLPPEDVPYSPTAKQELSAMVDADLELRGKLAESGELQRFGYHPLMECLHMKNSLRLEELVNDFGYPVMDVAGKDAADNAWLILQHAIGRPALLRAALKFYETLNGYQLSPASFAYLSDRIAFYERRPQTYGTQFDYDLNGEFAPWVIQNPDSLALKRRAVGLPPVEDVLNRFKTEKTPMKIDLKSAFQARLMQEKWLLNVGWCTMSDIERSRNNGY